MDSHPLAYILVNGVAPWLPGSIVLLAVALYTFKQSFFLQLSDLIGRRRRWGEAQER